MMGKHLMKTPKIIFWEFSYITMALLAFTPRPKPNPFSPNGLGFLITRLAATPNDMAGTNNGTPERRKRSQPTVWKCQFSLFVSMAAVGFFHNRKIGCSMGPATATITAWASQPRAKAEQQAFGSGLILATVWNPISLIP